MPELVHSIERFVFESGQSLERMKVGCVTHGRLNGRRDNTVLITHGTAANRHTYDLYIGPGKAFDTEKYFVVAVDAIGGGTSSQPSDGLGLAFPRYGIRDMVRAQYDLVTRGLDIPSLLAVGGPSMGAFQALEWGIQYPDFAKGLLLVVPAARTPNNFKAVVDTMIETIKLDPAWVDGKYAADQNPVEGLRRAAMVFAPWFLSDAYFDAMTTRESFNEALMVMAKNYEQWDAIGFMWRYLASREYDASVPFNGRMDQALARVSALALVLPSATDRVLPPQEARRLHEGLAKSIYREIPSILGHMAQNAGSETIEEYRFVSEAFREFLSTLQ